MSKNTETSPSKQKNIYKKAGAIGVGILAAASIVGGVKVVQESQQSPQTAQEYTVEAGDVPGANTAERIKSEQTASFLGGVLLDTKEDGTSVSYSYPLMEKKADADDNPLNVNNYNFFLAGEHGGEPVLTEIAVSPQMRIQLDTAESDVSIEALLVSSGSRIGQADPNNFSYRVKEVPVDQQALGSSQYDGMMVGMLPGEASSAQTQISR